MSDRKLKKKLRKKAVKLARFAARHDLKYVSIFADLDGGTFVHASAHPFDGDIKTYVSEFVSDEEAGR